jgi:hypothetical protein
LIGNVSLMFDYSNKVNKHNKGGSFLFLIEDCCLY